MKKITILLGIMMLLLITTVSAYNFPLGTQAFYNFENNTENLARSYFPLSGSPNYASGIYEDYSLDGIVSNGTQFLMDGYDNNYYPSFSTCLTRDLLSVPSGQGQYRFFHLGFQNTGGVNNNVYQSVSFWQTRTAPQTMRVIFNSQTDGRLDVIADTTGIYKMCFTYDRPSNSRLFIMNGINYTLPATTESPYSGIVVGIAEINAIYDNLFVINRSLTTTEINNYMECGQLSNCPEWNCTGYETCVNPMAVANCNEVTDTNNVGYTYKGNYSEFETTPCYYGMASSSSGTTSGILINAETKEEVGYKNQSNIVLYTPTTKTKAPALSILGTVQNFDLKTWATETWNNIKEAIIK